MGIILGHQISCMYSAKTIEDAILEATDEMKSQKKKSEDENA